MRSNLAASLMLLSASLTHGRDDIHPLGKIPVASQIERILAECLECTEKIEDPFERQDAQRDIVAIMARKGDCVGALALAEEINIEPNKSESLAKIASEHARRGHFKNAFQIVSRIDWDLLRSRTLIKIGLAQLEHGDPSGARSTMADARQIAHADYSHSRLMLLSEVANATLRVGDLQGARETAAQQDGPMRVYTLASIVGYHVKARDTTNAEATLAEVLKIALVQDQSTQGSALQIIAVAHAQQGNLSAADTLVEQISSSAAKASALCQVASALLEAKQEGVPNLLGRAVKIVERLPQVMAKVEGYREIASMYFKLKDRATGIKLMLRAQRTAEEMAGNGELSAYVLGDIGEAWLDAEELDAAYTAATSTYLGGYEKAHLLSALAGKHAQRRDDVTAKKLFAQAGKAANFISPDSSYRWGALRAIVVAQASAGYMDDALRTMITIEDVVYNRRVAQRDIAKIQSQSGDADGAIQWVERLTEPSERVQALLGIVEGLLQ